MTREETIAIVEQYIRRLEFAQADPGVDPREEDQQRIQHAVEFAKELLERVKAGDESAIQEISELIQGFSS